MSILSAFFTYLIVWWTVLFAVLPWGNRQPETHEAGLAPGAPVNANIKKKLIATTLLSFIVLGLVWFLITIEIIDFREVAREMDAKIYGDRSPDFSGE
jgi:predicted secreted protein